ncbi:MAG: cob(I)yrinic acid a,c-diamide adenosyltransferase [Ruminococcus sp.]|nr:cob(I)yrinic acid a,c-diamide adenosyltransferase [Ruminococcus sp.]
MLHIYTGNGKGKTTAAVGLAVRATGAGKSVTFIQFLKNGTSSEIELLKKLGIEVSCTECCNKFTSAMNEEELDELIAEHNALLRQAGRLINNGKTDMLVLDEFIGAYNKELLDTVIAEKLIADALSTDCELVLTGRDAPQTLCLLADYITEMLPHKHPYEKGIPARKGIEF